MQLLRADVSSGTYRSDQEPGFADPGGKTDNKGEGANTSDSVYKTSDKIWLLSAVEVYGSNVYGANNYEKNYTTQYDYYKNGNSNDRYKHNSPNQKCDWWQRSPYKTGLGQLFTWFRPLFRNRLRRCAWNILYTTA